MQLDELSPDPKPAADANRDPQTAADLVRAKVARAYEDEPDARTEAAEAAAEPAAQRSKHQQFMYELSNSGKDAITIQTEWHQYYESLSAKEKHQVWHEFYEAQAQPAVEAATAAAANPQKRAHQKRSTADKKTPKTRAAAKKTAAAEKRRVRDARSPEEIKSAIRDTVSAGGKLETKHHLQSLLFGLGMGALVLLIFLFSFFNEVIIAPFIQPSRVHADTPLIVGDNTVVATAQPEVIIPKINVEIPTDFSQNTTDENQIENALENGVVHYPTTVLPGQTGNAAFFGHSSNNIFNKGKYKFAFVLLHTLVKGDTFYLTYNQKTYVYKVIDRKIVDPSEVGVLGPVSGQTATATLITCDPPGTSLKRLVVVGQQISPDPATNTPAQTAVATSTPGSNLPGNGPTLWGRLTSTIVGKLCVAIIVLAVLLAVARRLRPLALAKANP